MTDNITKSLLCCHYEKNALLILTKDDVETELNIRSNIANNSFWSGSSNALPYYQHVADNATMTSKQPQYLAHVNGFLRDFGRLAAFVSGQEKKLTKEGDETLYKVVEFKQAVLARINTMLAFDEFTPEMAQYAKELKAVIGWRTPKYSGKIYRASLCSPLDIFIMAFRQRFYLPGFVSGVVNPNNLSFRSFPRLNANPDANYENAIFEIDTSEFPNFSTVFESPDNFEEECLLSCYNIYSWKGIRLVEVRDALTENLVMVPVISLKVEIYQLHHDLTSGSINASSEISMDWIKRKGDLVKARCFTPEQLTMNVKELFASYERNFGVNSPDPRPLTWLNASFDETSHPLRVSPESCDASLATGYLHNADMERLMQWQRKKCLEAGKKWF